MSTAFGFLLCLLVYVPDTLQQLLSPGFLMQTNGTHSTTRYTPCLHASYSYTEVSKPGPHELHALRITKIGC